MIQRIQSVYLLLAAIFTGLLFVLPVAEFSTGNLVYSLNAVGTCSVNPAFVPQMLIGMITMTCLSTLMSLVIIFMFRNRSRQALLVTLDMVVTILLLAAILVYTITLAGKTNASYQFLYPAVFPLIAWILQFMALRGIKKDDNLVKASDRIR